MDMDLDEEFKICLELLRDNEARIEEHKKCQEIAKKECNIQVAERLDILIEACRHQRGYYLGLMNNINFQIASEEYKNKKELRIW